MEPAANGDAGTAAEDGSTSTAAAAAANSSDGAAAAPDADIKAAADAADQASFFKLQDGEAPLAYAERVFERLYCSDIKEVLVMEVRGFSICCACRMQQRLVQCMVLLFWIGYACDGGTSWQGLVVGLCNSAPGWSHQRCARGLVLHVGLRR